MKMPEIFKNDFIISMGILTNLISDKVRNLFSLLIILNKNIIYPTFKRLLPIKEYLMKI